MRWLLTVALVALAGCQTTASKPEERKPQSVVPVPNQVLPFFWDAERKAFVQVDDVVGRLAAARCVMVGEFHTSIGCHQMQLWALKTLLALGKKPVVVVEWFQKPYQKALDDYVSGKIEEQELLKETEYKKRWGYDWTLLREIIRLCREHGLRIVAGNVPSELSKAVARAGLAALPDKLKKWLPKQMETENMEHRKYVLARFAAMIKRGILSKEKLNHFYEAQVVWDEAFAEATAEALKSAGPDGVVVLFAGAGHLGHRTAVPARFKRRTQKEPLILLPLPATIPIKALTQKGPSSDALLFFYTK